MSLWNCLPKRDATTRMILLFGLKQCKPHKSRKPSLPHKPHKPRKKLTRRKSPPIKEIEGVTLAHLPS